VCKGSVCVKEVCVCVRVRCGKRHVRVEEYEKKIYVEVCMWGMRKMCVC